MSTNDYFEEIGAWPQGAHKIDIAYAWGFALSVVLTFVAYLLVVHHALFGTELTVTLLGLAFVQCVIQLVCFLHLGGEKSSRARFIALLAAAVIVLIVMSGSLWIMFTLNQRMMPSTDQMEQYMDDQGGGF